jgi:uncharacterized protein
MSRILFFILLAIVAYMVMRSFQRRGDQRRGDQRRESHPGTAAPEVMVSCATCGLHLPRREALLLGERYFCCEEHRRHPPSA